MCRCACERDSDGILLRAKEDTYIHRWQIYNWTDIHVTSPPPQTSLSHVTWTVAKSLSHRRAFQTATKHQVVFRKEYLEIYRFFWYLGICLCCVCTYAQCETWWWKQGECETLIHAYIHIHTYIRTFIRIHAHTCTHTHTHTHTYTHTYKYLYTYIHTFMYVKYMQQAECRNCNFRPNGRNHIAPPAHSEEVAITSRNITIIRRPMNIIRQQPQDKGVYYIYV